MPDSLLSLLHSEDRERSHRRGLVACVTHPHLPTPGSWHDHDRRRIEALLTEMAREGLGYGRGFDFPDLRDTEWDIRAITQRLGAGLRMLEA
jgi:hypothetical protein